MLYKIFTKSLIIVALFLAIQSCSTNRMFRSAIDWKDFLSTQDPVLDTLTGYFYDGPITGNGLIGTVMRKMDKDRFNGDTNEILFEINRADLVDTCSHRTEGYYWSRMQVGRFEFFAIESLAGEPCVVKSDIKVDSLSTYSAVKIAKKSAYVFSVPIQKNQRITFYKNTTPNLKLTAISKDGTENNYWGSKRIKRK